MAFAFKAAQTTGISKCQSSRSVLRGAVPLFYGSVNIESIDVESKALFAMNHTSP